ncbi:MAG: hypothetical protein Alpg2KO_03610 [Alphaproteobacteria bacterium]
MPTDAQTIYTASKGRICADGQPMDLHGINWFGLDTPDLAPHGLWTGRSLDSFMHQIRDLGFNSLRLPVCPGAIRLGNPVADWAEPIGSHGRQVLEETLWAADRAGLHVLLDLHTHDPLKYPGGLAPTPYEETGSYTRSDWFSDLQELARLADEHPSVFGIDLFNEPHGWDWQTWSSEAAAAAQVVLKQNPRMVIFVEGTGHKSSDGQDDAFWGSWLAEAMECLPDIPSDKLVYSPHIYGPDVFDQPYFQTSDFPHNLPDLWDRHFGHLYGTGHTVCLGEFGGFARPESRDAVWLDTFVDWMRSKGDAACGQWFYWCLNPNSADTGGVLQDDWLTPVKHKHQALQGIMTHRRLTV